MRSSSQWWQQYFVHSQCSLTGLWFYSCLVGLMWNAGGFSILGTTIAIPVWKEWHSRSFWSLWSLLRLHSGISLIFLQLASYCTFMGFSRALFGLLWFFLVGHSFKLKCEKWMIQKCGLKLNSCCCVKIVVFLHVKIWFLQLRQNFKKSR